MVRNLRLIERQYRMLDRQKHFVSQDGDTRPVPKDFTPERIKQFQTMFGLEVIVKLVRRIRWTVTTPPRPSSS